MSQPIQLAYLAAIYSHNKKQNQQGKNIILLMTSKKRQVLKKFLLDHLDGDNPTEHLNQEFTDEIKL